MIVRFIVSIVVAALLFVAVMKYRRNIRRSRTGWDIARTKVDRESARRRVKSVRCKAQIRRDAEVIRKQLFHDLKKENDAEAR